MCKPHYGNQDFFPLANGVVRLYFKPTVHVGLLLIHLPHSKYPVPKGICNSHFDNEVANDGIAILIWEKKSGYHNGVYK